MSRVDQEIWIKDIYTADGDLDETNAFEWDDPFSIVLELERSVARDSPAYPLEIMVQIVNPRTDPSDVGPWKGEGGKPLYSLDFTREVALDPSSGISLGWKTKLKYWLKFSSYGKALERVKEGATRGGVYGVQATARLLYFPSFAATRPMAYAYHFRGDPTVGGGTGSGTGGGSGSGSGGGGSGGGGGGDGRGSSRPGRGPIDIVRPTPSPEPKAKRKRR